MRRAGFVLAAAVCLAFASISSAGADSFHFKNALFSGGSLVFTGTALGLGNSDYQFDLEGTADVVAMCENKGGNQAPGQNPLEASVSNSATESTDSNGQAPVAITVDDPTLDAFGGGISKKAAGCPNGNWNVVDVEVLQWTSAHLVVTDLDGGAVVFDQVFNCSGAGATLECSEA